MSSRCSVHPSRRIARVLEIRPAARQKILLGHVADENRSQQGNVEDDNDNDDDDNNDDDIEDENDHVDGDLDDDNDDNDDEDDGVL